MLSSLFSDLILRQLFNSSGIHQKIGSHYDEVYEIIETTKFFMDDYRSALLT